MIRFTDSPYERMMTQKPVVGREAREPPAHPPDHPSHGCAKCRDAPSLGLCYKKMLKGKYRKSTRLNTIH